jgi:hypothetical protein
VDSVLPVIRAKVEVADGKVLVASGRAVSEAVEKTDSEWVAVEDIGSGEKFEANKKSGDGESESSPLVTRAIECMSAEPNRRH